MIKRESGENPEQSRCCMFHKTHKQTPLTTGKHFREGAYSGNKSEDLPIHFHILKLSRKELGTLNIKDDWHPLSSPFRYPKRDDQVKEIFYKNKLCQVYLSASLMGITLAFFL